MRKWSEERWVSLEKAYPDPLRASRNRLAISPRKFSCAHLIPFSRTPVSPARITTSAQAARHRTPREPTPLLGRKHHFSVENTTFCPEAASAATLPACGKKKVKPCARLSHLHHKTRQKAGVEIVRITSRVTEDPRFPDPIVSRNMHVAVDPERDARCGDKLVERRGKGRAHRVPSEIVRHRARTRRVVRDHHDFFPACRGISSRATATTPRAAGPCRGP